MNAAAAGFDRQRAQRRVEGIAAGNCAAVAGNAQRRPGAFWAASPIRAIFGGLTVWMHCARRFTRCRTAGSWPAGPLARLHGAASEKGWDTIVCLAPEDPGRIEHLLIPGLGLAFVTTRPGMEYSQKPYRRIRLDAMTEMEGKTRLRFQTRMAALLRQEAVAALKDAKAAHDALEAVYNPYVDFDGVRAAAAMEAGRLLSWLG